MDVNGRGLLGSAVFSLQLGFIPGALIISGVQHDTAAWCYAYNVTLFMGMGVPGPYETLCTFLSFPCWQNVAAILFKRGVMRSCDKSLAVNIMHNVTYVDIFLYIIITVCSAQ